ncbi:hypothetical protein C4577_01615 [Candidatus Parcubacteria bacterium]|nr:MAG: hypothetical protein C4577_01615 [Candidatus Parcubacteria bacterium]
MKILVVGYMGYHEYTTTLPILHEIEKLGHTIYRCGGDTDFFMEANKPEMVQNWLDTLVTLNLSNYDRVFFVDYWNMTIPIYLWKKGLENPAIKFVGLCHGTVWLPDDVAQQIHNATAYERFLKSAYDKILLPYDWLKNMIVGPDAHLANKFSVTLWPTNLLQERVRPHVPFSNTVIYAHRFTKDKGAEDFIKFVAACRNDSELMGTEFIVTDEGTDPGLGIRFLGRMNQDELKVLCCLGGYAWSSAKSETFGYAVLDLLSYGLTPLINNHPAYSHIPNRYKYSWDFSSGFNDKSLHEAMVLLKGRPYMSHDEWYYMMEPMKDNALKMAKEIVS